MSKRIISLVIILCIILLSICAFSITVNAYYGTYNDGTLYYNILNNKITITDCIETASGVLEIPSTINGYPVTGIESYAFYNCGSLTSVTIPDSVTSIGEQAFFDCSSLNSIYVDENNAKYMSQDGVLFNKNKTELICCPSVKMNTYTLPKSVISICAYAFYNCNRLTDIYYLGTIEEYNKISINGNSYIDCSLIHCIDGDINNTKEEDFTFVNGVVVKYIGAEKVVHIPEKINDREVTAIADKAFLSSHVTYVIIPNTVKTIGKSAFPYTNLRVLEIPNSVTSIGTRAFADCSRLTSVTIPDKVTSIVESTFSGCSSLISVIIPDSVTSIGGYAFGFCSNLTSVTIPDSVTIIEYGAFSDCSSLKNIALPNIKNIGLHTFNNCYMLERIVIPKTVKSISSDAFYGCYSLSEVCYEGTKEEWQQIAIASGNDYLNNATIVYNYVESKCNIYYDTNGSNDVIDTVEATIGDTIKVSGIVPKKEHYKFIGWTTDNVSQVPKYLPNDEFEAEKSITLYAIWEPVPYLTATYNNYGNYKLFFASFNNMPENSVIYFAEYFDGTLLSTEKRNYTSNSEVFASFEKADKYKIFVWNDAMMPLCEAYEIE